MKVSWRTVPGTRLLAGLGLVAGLTACGEAPEPEREAREPTIAAGAPAVRPAGGDWSHARSLFTQHCAECHGDRAEGDPQWRQRNARGRFRAPPLNGTGHMWHHPRGQLRAIIKFGRPPAVSDMPGWEGVLSDGEIDLLIDWLQSLWPEEAYTAWRDIDRRAQQQTPPADR